ncbi:MULTISPECIES: SAM-dependent methyltransferase [Streptomyces]|uniref:S-adenosyl methyltransferase n=1 Tax=Streptomyces pini TaxID=1520580 RepID=A0A1I3ZSH3_9ACTN|nr:SAM-dependent methyltransferase [Streptomyces pini]SFK47114.1 S-adenosyl methyltransferase [Streptomyces pini]
MTDGRPRGERDAPPAIDRSIPHSARIWNYWLGGKDNYTADREAGDQYQEIFPGIVELARASRGFLSRAVTHLAGELGIRQFLDIGTGLPTADNTHEVAQRAAPGSRIVYVDNDPLVLAHARALLTSTPEGATAYIDADLRRPDTILAEAARTLDLDRPVGLMLMNILGHIEDYDEARATVKRLMAALPSGSCLVSNDGTDGNEAFNRAQRFYNEMAGVPYLLRTPEQIAGYFRGLEVLEPGVVPVSRWRPQAPPTGASLSGDLPPAVDEYGGVGVKP